MSLTLNVFFHCVRYALDKSSYSEIFLKPKQLIILESLLLGLDTIGVLPTGYGKSVIFHLLPYLFDYFYNGGEAGDGIVVVVAPLNSLIYDQLRSLNDRGIKSAFLTKGVFRGVIEDDGEGEEDEHENYDEVDILMEQGDALILLQSGYYRIVFAHPEAFVSCNEGRKLLLSDVYQKRVVAFVIDEAHLMIMWGNDFRVDYSRLSVLASIFPHSPVLVLTATAPRKHIATIKDLLVVKSSKTVIGDLNRPNIFLEKRKRKPTRQGAESYETEILPIALGLKDLQVAYPLTIIYLPLKWCGYAHKFFLEVLGDKAYYPPDGSKNPQNCLIAQFHAPQTKEMKEEIMRQLTGNRNQSVIRVIFGTIAIGLGINIQNVRQVVHLEVPRTMESYYQEIGRAGRDGKPAKAVLCFNASDIAHNKPGMTEEMRNFCLSEEACMRKQLLTYLGSKIITCHSNNCCSNCQKLTESPCMSADDGLSLNDSTHKEICHPIPVRVRVSTQQQRLQLYTKLKEYRLQLGNSRYRFGGIDSNTGVTLQLLSAITAACEYISSADDICSLFEVWDVAHALAFFDIIQKVFNTE